MTFSNMKKASIYIGTSGWHYNDWIGRFYPPEIKGYNELRYYAEHFRTVENNSSFYRISKASTYKTWDRMTPEGFVFSLKLNRLITHINRLKLTLEVREKTAGIIESLQTLKSKLGALVIQLPASFKPDHKLLEAYLSFLKKEIEKHTYAPDLAIEFRAKDWFSKNTYDLLEKNNVALVAAQSSRYPGAQEITADIIYIRLHGPEKLFASKYSMEQLSEWADYINQSSKKVKKVYVYFNNDFYGYALENAKELSAMIK
jgi:uncharacterized protein YecE (DUF72 family)